MNLLAALILTSIGGPALSYPAKKNSTSDEGSVDESIRSYSSAKPDHPVSRAFLLRIPTKLEGGTESSYVEMNSESPLRRSDPQVQKKLILLLHLDDGDSSEDSSRSSQSSKDLSNVGDPTAPPKGYKASIQSSSKEDQQTTGEFNNRNYGHSPVEKITMRVSSSYRAQGFINKKPTKTAEKSHWPGTITDVPLRESSEQAQRNPRNEGGFNSNQEVNNVAASPVRNDQYSRFDFSRFNTQTSLSTQSKSPDDKTPFHSERQRKVTSEKDIPKGSSYTMTIRRPAVYGVSSDNDNKFQTSSSRANERHQDIHNSSVESYVFRTSSEHSSTYRPQYEKKQNFNDFNPSTRHPYSEFSESLSQSHEGSEFRPTDSSKGNSGEHLAFDGTSRTISPASESMSKQKDTFAESYHKEQGQSASNSRRPSSQQESEEWYSDRYEDNTQEAGSEGIKNQKDNENSSNENSRKNKSVPVLFIAFPKQESETQREGSENNDDSDSIFVLPPLYSQPDPTYDKQMRSTQSSISSGDSKEYDHWTTSHADTYKQPETEERHVAQSKTEQENRSIKDNDNILMPTSLAQSSSSSEKQQYKTITLGVRVSSSAQPQGIQAPDFSSELRDPQQDDSRSESVSVETQTSKYNSKESPERESSEFDLTTVTPQYDNDNYSRNPENEARNLLLMLFNQAKRNGVKVYDQTGESTSSEYSQHASDTFNNS